MTIWNIHFLNARHALTGDMAEIRATAREAVAQVGHLVTLPPFDLVIRAETGGGIPDRGVGGRAAMPGLIEVTVNPGRFTHDHLMRTLVHEMHHLVRWEGPGYGRSLGEALVSEGLAGHFVTQVLGREPDPWDAARPVPGCLRQVGHLWARRDFDFDEWFHGRGKIRKWTGYGIGHRLIAEHLAQASDENAASLAWTPADMFRPALRRLMAAEGLETDDEASEGIAEVQAAAAPGETGTSAPQTPAGI
nr:DUF2268 domain-containing putative Zn-dependent protease [Paracoccus saliphilus]